MEPGVAGRPLRIPFFLKYSQQPTGVKMKSVFGYAGLATAVVMLGIAVMPAKAAAPSAAKGKEIFEQCAVCHNADSTEKKMGPGLKGLFKKAKLNNGKPVTEANIKALVNAGGNGMPLRRRTRRPDCLPEDAVVIN
jgi:mono/diheme cytochrome c family protein